MSAALWLLVGAAGGFAAAAWLLDPGTCCATVAGGVRDRVGSTLGPWAVALGDQLGLWRFTPALAGSIGGR